jgi:hypothetical protein
MAVVLLVLKGPSDTSGTIPRVLIKAAAGSSLTWSASFAYNTAGHRQQPTTVWIEGAVNVLYHGILG